MKSKWNNTISHTTTKVSILIWITNETKKNLHYIFSNCCTHTSTGTPTTVYCYTPLIKNGNMKKETYIKNKYNISHIYICYCTALMGTLYNSPPCQVIFPIPVISFMCKKVLLVHWNCTVVHRTFVLNSVLYQSCSFL
jgi:hypothetical protein